MNDNRMFEEYVRSKARSLAPSLDDLVEEDRGRSTHGSARSSNDEEDELEAYMASIQKESIQIRKKSKLESKAVDSDEELEESVPSEVVEDLEADLAAAIAGTNTSANKTTKKLNQLSRKDVFYRPFRKDFYVEVPELAKLREDEVKELRMSLENVKVVGKSCPKPITCWAHCGLSRKVMEVLKKLKYVSPTPIQAQAIPAIMSGRDVIGIAKTGCGKTLSFLLPMFRHILDQPKLEKNEGPISVVITPTRELATQICEDAAKFTKTLGLRVVAVYGGPNISEQIGMLKPGAEIVICTPGRMIEVLTVNSGRVTNLNRCTFLVLDEADRLFDMGFEKQIRSIVDLIRPDRQTVMFSATFPKIMEAHARRILNKPIEIQVGGRSVVCKDVDQKVEIIEEDDKFLRLLPILQKHVNNQTSAIVFVSKQEKADSLLEDLMQAYDPNCLALHGGIDKDDRISTFASFKGGHTKVLVATSVAARGLDVKNCICVVNYDVPNHYEDYVHRCGRTGRAGNKGFAYTFITPDQGQYASDLIKALEISCNPVPPELQNLWDTFRTEAEKTGKKVWTSSGFSGRGFKFDEAEAQLVNEKKKYQKKSLGMQNSDDEEEDTGVNVGGVADSDTDLDTATLESEIRSLSGAKTDTPKSVIRKLGSRSEMKKTSEQAVSLEENVNATKLDLARQRAAILLSRKRGLDLTSPVTKPTSSTAITDANSTISSIVAKQLAEQRAQALRTRLGGKPTLSGASIDHKNEVEALSLPSSNPNVSERLELKLEINDYHQQVRRRLTSKEALAKISEHCEVGITVRGKFCPPGDRPMEPKLYLAIEGTSHASVEEAHRELLRLVKDEYTRINSQPASRGRYRLM